MRSKETDRAEWVINRARIYQQRSGQYLFNELPYEVAEIVRKTNFDPFYKDFTLEEVMQWFDDHIIFDDNDEPILLFTKDEILWEKK